MYLLIDKSKAVKTDEIIGIFDLDRATVSKNTRDYLSKNEKNGCVETLSFEELPLSFVVCAPNKKSDEQRVYISPNTTQTLLKRINNKTPLK